MKNNKKEIQFSQFNKNINNIPSESSKLLIVDSILKKWSKLQKAIKESIILKELIIKQQKIDFSQLKEYFIEYYNTKLKIRTAYEEMEMLKDNKRHYKNIFFKKNAEEIFLKSLKPINDLLFIFRNNYDYVMQLIELIELETDEKKNNSNNKFNNYYYKNSIVELFCNQFYDNILIPNPEQEELLILIYKLIEREIFNIKEASLDLFLNENTFLGKFIDYFLRKPELKIFLSRLLSPLILYIENENEEIDISIFSKNFSETNNTNTTLKENKELDNNDFNNNINFLFDKIPKTKIKFKNFLELEEQKEKESQSINNIDIGDNDNEKNLQAKPETDMSDYNDEYKEELSEEIMNQKIDKTNINDLKDFYITILEKIKSQPNIYNNSHLISILKQETIKEIQTENINKLKKSFLLIKSQIDKLLQSLIDKITAIPYIIRCICKIISKLILCKFPFLSKYNHNCFIGNFIFEKYIFPALRFKNNNIIGDRIFSSKTKDFLNTIVTILSNAVKCALFNSSTEPMKTIFNHYLIEIIPLLNKFYDKLIDVKFPNILESLIKNKNKNKNKKLNYNYFKENSDEIINLQSICLSIDDMLYILNIINNNQKKFEKLKNSELFFKSINLIEKDILENISNNETDTSIFFVLFNEKYHPKIYNLLNDKDTNISKNNKNEEELKSKRIKLCIKNILKGLNNINSKSYTYLNLALSNDKFFTLLKYTLEDIGELNQLNIESDKNYNHQIPLKWYGQYINNNKKGLDNSYKENDYKKLYDEINKEEIDNLNNLNKLSAIVIARDGMNLRCCEKIMEKTNNDLHHVEQAKKYVKIEKFINNEKIEVCVRIKNNNINKEIEAKLKSKKRKPKTSFFGLGKKSGNKVENINENTNVDMNPPTIIVTQDFSFCTHKNMEFIEKSKKNNVCLILSKRKIIPSHSYYIKDFIQKFSDSPWGEDIINKDEKPKDIVIKDITKGERNNQIYKTFQNYMDIIRKKIRSPSEDNKNLFRNISQKECDKILEIIENFILRQIYNYIFKIDYLKEDKDFYEKTKCLDWVMPNHLEIEKYYIDQLGMAELCIKKFDNERSVFDKLNCIKDAFTNINNNIKYSEGKNEEAGQDEIVPIFQYLLIKAQPKRMCTNINYINCFLSEEHINGQYGYFVSQLESSFSFIMNINCKFLNMNEEEFKTNYENAKKRHNIQ